MRERPNIVIIYADQQRHDTINALGSTGMHTPNLDRLVREGTSFTQATTPCPVCMPARWSLHCGQWTTAHRCYSNHHPGPQPVTHMPGVLRDAGYRTGLVGKNHSFLTPTDLTHFVENPRPLDPSAAQQRQHWLNEKGRKRFPRLCGEAIPGGVEADPDHAKTDEAIRFVKNSGAEPFFLWLSYLHPHTPYYVPEPFYSMYTRTLLRAPFVEESLVGKPFRQQFHKANNDSILPFDSDAVMEMRRVYAGMVSLLDAEVGRFLGFLQARGLGEDTIVIYMSDHGDYMGDHGLITKSPSLYDCLVRTPFIVRWPGRVPENMRSTELISHVDVMPTVLSAAGCSVPVTAQGSNLLPYLEGTSSALRDTVFSEYGIPGDPYTLDRLHDEGLAPGAFINPGDPAIPWEGNPVSLSGRIRMARTHEWKVIQEEGGTCELYDLRNDPHELTNLYGRTEYRTTQTALLNRLETWKSSLPGIEMDGTTTRCSATR